MPADAVFEVSAIALDLDGTLLDTVHDIAAAVNAVLADAGHPPLPKGDIRDLVGKGMPNLMRRALARVSGRAPEAVAEAEIAAAVERCQAHYETQLGRETEIFAGVARGLERLAAMGFPLAVITNKAARFVQPHLDQAGIGHHFDLVIGGDTLPTRKPEPGMLLHAAKVFRIAPARLLMVGDSANDVGAARAAGCPVLVLPYGYSEGTPVQDLGADGIVSGLDEVAHRVRRVPPG